MGYFLAILDYHSRSLWIHLIAEKTEVADVMKKFFAMVQNRFNKKIKIMQYDNETKFVCLKLYFDEQGILHQTSVVGTPPQNGRVEHKHLHMLKVAHALQFQAYLPIKFWGECVLITRYLINRMPSTLLGDKTPYDLLLGNAPSYSHNFGCLAYVHDKKLPKDKFRDRSRPCVFLGIHMTRKGGAFIILKLRFILSWDVTFVEDQYPYASNIGIVKDK